MGVLEPESYQKPLRGARKSSQLMVLARDLSNASRVLGRDQLIRKGCRLHFGGNGRP